jgi:hypothetical protein
MMHVFVYVRNTRKHKKIIKSRRPAREISLIEEDVEELEEKYEELKALPDGEIVN